MSKMCYFSKEFSKIASGQSTFRPQRSLSLNFGDLKLRDFAKLQFCKRIMTKSDFFKISRTSFKWRHRYYITEKHHQTNVTDFFYFEPLRIKICGYARVDI